ncbi:ATP-binding protein [Paraburkholderia youngii]|uniref:Thymidine kinase n=1 Tax=Paraburkholderia youngii TaxID=2782701 RepID=A0A7W8P305_9BURK|nr:ATP-binding protein [Paraburkholderia youngii]MBB5400530.1 thymidine kinase [Paraburkholderia youngii]
MAMLTREQAIAGSPEDKERYLKWLFVPHRNLDRLSLAVNRRMTAGAGLSLTVIVGPTGAGKTTFGRMLLRDLLKRYQVQIQERRHIIPAVMSEVDPADNKGEINFALLYNRLCSDLMAPSALDMVAVREELDEPYDPVKRSRIEFERALKARELRHLILDEAVHFTNSKTDPLLYGDLLKSLSNRTGFNLLLLGAYGCEELAIASDQLGRRVGVVHYPRYQQTEEDAKEFGGFLKSYAAEMPYKFGIELTDHQIEYMLVGAVGIAGLAADVLKTACERCSVERYPKWSEAKLREAMPSKAAQQKIARTTIEGEVNVAPYLQTDKEVDYLTEGQVRAELRQEKVEREALNGRGGR